MWKQLADRLTQRALFPSEVDKFAPLTQHVSLRIVGQLPVRKRTLSVQLRETLTSDHNPSQLKYLDPLSFPSVCHGGAAPPPWYISWSSNR